MNEIIQYHKLTANELRFVEKIKTDFTGHVQHNKISVQNLAVKFDVVNQNLIKELTEFAIVQLARQIATGPGSIKERFNRIVDLYNTQVNLSHRTSQSMMLQQYSTPAPIGFLAGIFCGVDKPGSYFEPSAGNGMLTIASKPEYFTVNEVDDVRLGCLMLQGFNQVTQRDASQTFYDYIRKFDAVITNPPFGKLPEPITFSGLGAFKTQILDHAMAINALDAMKDGGKAAIIIGGHTDYDDKGRIMAGKNRDFFLYLYHFYNVMDVINIDGHKLYSRMGTAFNVRLILIDGRKAKPEGLPPIVSSRDQAIVYDFEELFERVMQFVEPAKKPWEIWKDEFNEKINERAFEFTKYHSPYGPDRLIASYIIRGENKTFWHDYEIVSNNPNYNTDEKLIEGLKEYIVKWKDKAYMNRNVSNRGVYETSLTQDYIADKAEEVIEIIKKKNKQSVTSNQQPATSQPATSPQQGYKFKAGDRVSFIGTAQKVHTGTIRILGKQGWYEVAFSSKKSTMIDDSRLVPAIASCKKETESGGSYKAFKSIPHSRSSYYWVTFIDNKYGQKIVTDDREDAMRQAIKNRLREETSSQQPATSDPDRERRLRMAKVKMKMLKLKLELMKQQPALSGYLINRDIITYEDNQAIMEYFVNPENEQKNRLRLFFLYGSPNKKIREKLIQQGFMPKDKGREWNLSAASMPPIDFADMKLLRKELLNG